MRLLPAPFELTHRAKPDVLEAPEILASSA